jgi:hypothetical protein
MHGATKKKKVMFLNVLSNHFVITNTFMVFASNKCESSRFVISLALGGTSQLSPGLKHGLSDSEA